MLSGPAGGVVGYAVTTPGPDPVIGFDMGGTSTDVSRFAGTYEHVFESTTAGVTIQVSKVFTFFSFKYNYKYSTLFNPNSRFG